MSNLKHVFVMYFGAKKMKKCARFDHLIASSNWDNYKV